MGKLTLNLRIHADHEPLIQTPTGTAFNRTPPLDPPEAMASPLPSRGPSRSATPFSDPRTSSRQSDPFSDPSNSPKRGRLARLKQSLKDNWEAGTDPKGFHEKRRSGTSTPTTRSNSRDPVSPLRERTADFASSQPNSRGPSRAATDSSRPSQPTSLSQSASRRRAKDEKQYEKGTRDIERQASQRRKVKHQREIERGDFLFSESGTGSPRHAPLHMLEEANEARQNQAEEVERLRSRRDWERRRSDEERRRAHAPAGRQPPQGRGETYGKNPYQRQAEPYGSRSSSRRREPEYDKSLPNERPLAGAHGEADYEYAAENAYQPSAALDPFKDPFRAQQVPVPNDITPHQWSGLQPRTPSPHTRSPTSSLLSKYLATGHEDDPFPSPARRNWSSSPPRQQQDQSTIPPLYYRQAVVNEQPRDHQTSDYNPYEEWLSPLAFQRKASEEPPQQQQQQQQAARGEFETIISRMVMPDQDEARQERDLYHAHVERRRGEAAGREFF